ncbi:hypothetical protein ACIOJD_10475 [Streptomyces sp. NPDC088116]|uniref:hypothetical protein n=1 Tax=Streptomyces sp. NPDC088116 TaxID=3365825 RepID=UPI003817E00A
MTDARSPIRAVRAVAFAAVCVTLAALGHAFASGAPDGAGATGVFGASGHGIPAGALWAAFGATGAVAWLAGGRRRGAGSIGAGLLTVQGILHMIFAGALPFGPSESPHESHVTDGGMGMGMGMGAGTGSAVDVGTSAGTGTAAGSGPEGKSALLAAVTDGSAGMLAAHLLAAVVCALWLARGEAAFFRLAHAIGALAFSPLRLLFTGTRLPAAPRLIRPGSGAPAPHRFRGVLLAHTLSQRGPPVCRTARVTAPGAAVITAFITTV